MSYELPEAGGIAFTTIYSRTGVPINITSRSENTKDALQDLLETIKWAMETHSFTTEKPMPPTASSPQPDPAAKIAMQEGNQEMAKELQTQAVVLPVSRKGENVQYQTFDADIVEVLPQPDNKTTIRFYGTNDKYPRVSVNKWKVESANGLMKYVTSEDMSKAAKYSLHCRVYYTDGQQYTTTDGELRHYKDVEHVRPI